MVEKEHERGYESTFICVQILQGYQIKSFANEFNISSLAVILYVKSDSLPMGLTS
jgi:hypothetical protein